MLLSRLELQGFKSFPEKISLDLGHQITAIVGPNGSGKSNITDSVRWLLGERDARNLRGVKGEDLIFAGTEKRPRVGLAQATIYFDNSSGFFPYDFREVSISRRVSRDGESQFFINKAEVRLKDLIDALAKVKLGARGLTIINQGENEVFLKANPTERRAMIEEILGLKEYQLKKTDAVRRLETTAINLEKANALIEEIKPHLRSLKRQVSRYEGREVLAGELKQLENNFYGNRFGRLNSELQELEKKEQGLKASLENREAALKKVEIEFEAISTGEPKALDELRQLQTQREKLLSSRRELERSSAKLEAQIELRKDEPVETAQLQRTIEEIRAVVRPLLDEEELGKVKAGIQRIATLVETILKPRQGEIPADFSKEHQALVSELKKLDQELEDLGRREKEEQKLLEGFNQNFRRAYEEVERERKEFEKLRNEENQILLRRERTETRLADLKEELDGIGLDINSLNFGTSDVPNITLMSGHRMSKDGATAGPEVMTDEAVLKRMFKLRSDLAGIGEVDEALVKEAKETEERYEFLTKEVGDMERAVADLKNLIQELDQKIYGEFNSAVKTINEEFTKFIKIIFGGGKARLIVQTNELNDAGIDIEVSLPKKKVKGLEVLSGGERSLVSIAALFALISVSPPPFLVLDEVDAALDESNARRFAEILKDFSKKTQFVIVTHNRVTMEAADVLYGVTMSTDGTSKIVSLKLST